MTHSLWLVPHSNNPFTKSMQELINDTVPSTFSLYFKSNPKHSFAPHITLTPGIELQKVTNGASPEDWLNGLDLPVFKKEFDECILEMDHLEAGEPFFRKLAIDVNKLPNLITLATSVYQQTVASGDEDATKKWVEQDYKPHLSLLYANIPTKDVQSRLPTVETQLGYAIGDIFACCGGTLCMGGYLVLVDTSKEVSEWEVLAKREVDWIMWRMGKNMGLG